MKNFYLRYLILFAALLASINMYGQNKYVLTILQNKDWMLQNSPVLRYYDVIERFSSTEFIQTMVYEGKEYSIKSLYYLSDSIPTSFEHQKVGKVQNGKYVIGLFTRKDGEGGQYKEMVAYEILEMTDQYLKKKNLQSAIVLEFKAK